MVDKDVIDYLEFVDKILYNFYNNYNNFEKIYPNIRISTNSELISHLISIPHNKLFVRIGELSTISSGFVYNNYNEQILVKKQKNGPDIINLINNDGVIIDINDIEDRFNSSLLTRTPSPEIIDKSIKILSDYNSIIIYQPIKLSILGI